MRRTLEDNPMRLIALNLILALAFTLTACGGGDDDTTPPPETDTGTTETDTGGGFPTGRVDSLAAHGSCLTGLSKAISRPGPAARTSGSEDWPRSTGSSSVADRRG